MSKTLVSCPGCQALVSPEGCCPLCGDSLRRVANPPVSPSVASPAPQAGVALAESGMDFLAAPPSESPRTAGWMERPPLPGGYPRVPGYEITAELGRGGMGVVYMARQVDLKRVVALKMILAGDFASPDDRARFKAEAESVARLHHPNIVQIYEIGEHDQKPYFSLEYVAGGSLHEQLGAPQPPRQAAELIAILAKGMHAAHLGGIVHRDLKPGNILLQPPGLQPPSESCSPRYGIPKITDFGLAKQLDVEAKTLSGTIMGTPQYMAPEQARGKVKEIGPWADIYALGAIFYEMLTGRPPFQADSSMDTIMLVVSAEPVPPRQLQPKVPPDLETICLKCLEKDIFKRYPSAAELADDLQRFLTDQPIVARPVGALERTWKWARRRPAVAGLLAAVVVVALVGLGGILGQWREAVIARGVAEEKTVKANAALAERNLNHYYRSVALAHLRWQNRDIGQARVMLAECTPELRDWEWRYLNRLCHAELGVILGTGQPWLQVACSPDGRYLAAAGMDGTVKIWDFDTRKELANCRGHQGAAWSVTFSPDSKLLASGGEDLKVCLWAVPSGQLLDTLPKYKEPDHKHLGPVRGLAFSPDGVKLASAGNNVIIWDVASGKTLADFAPPNIGLLPRGEFQVKGDLPWGGAQRLSFDPDGHRLAFVAMNHILTIMDLPAGRVGSIKTSQTMFDVAFSPNSKWLATGNGNSSVKVRDHTGVKELLTLSGARDTISGITFSPDSSRLVGASTDETVLIWELPPSQPPLILRGHTGAVRGVAFHPDGRRLASAGNDGAIRIWDSQVDPEAGTAHIQSKVEAVAFGPGGNLVAACCDDGLVQVWERRNLATVWIWPGHEMDHANALAISPDGRFVAAGGRARNDTPGIVLLWDLKTGQEVRTLRMAEHQVSGLAFSPDGSLYASTKPFGTQGDPKRCPIVGWNIATGQETIRTVGHPDGVTGLAFTADGRLLASSGNDGLVRIWDPRSGHELQVLSGHRDVVHAVAFHPSGQWLVSGGGDHEVILWNLTTGQPDRTLKAHKKPVFCLAFSKNGQRLTSGGADHAVKLWDIATGQDVLTLSRHTGSVSGLAFSPDGAWLASGGSDRTVLLWHAPE